MTGPLPSGVRLRLQSFVSSPLTPASGMYGYAADGRTAWSYRRYRET